MAILLSQVKYLGFLLTSVKSADVYLRELGGDWAPHYHREEDPSGREEAHQEASHQACEEASQFPGSLMVPFTRTAGEGREGAGAGCWAVTGSFGR